jgi:hypothetical protein
MDTLNRMLDRTREKLDVVAKRKINASVGNRNKVIQLASILTELLFGVLDR